MEKIGIFGGTFDPPHVGHMQAAAHAIDALGLDRLLLVPAGQAPHKPPAPGRADAAHRQAMLALAVSDPRMEVSGLELSREGESYTCDTVASVAAQYPGAELYLLLGSDMFVKFDSWKNASEIARQVTLAVMSRGGKAEADAIARKKTELEAAGTKAIVLHNPVCPISSTQLRRLLAFGCGGAFLPEGVEAFIREKGLYHVNADWKRLPMDRLEDVVISLLNPNRIRHVLGCRDTAVELARHWGADPVDAARAGILHDITKALDGPLQLTLCEAYGRILDDFSRKYPKTLHALTGSMVAQRIFGENEAVVSAICYHTTGRAEMNLLETIIYVADYMEPNRDFPGVEKLRALAFSDIREALKLGLQMTLEHLRQQGSEVSPASRETLAWLESGAPISP